MQHPHDLAYDDERLLGQAVPRVERAEELRAEVFSGDGGYVGVGCEEGLRAR